MSAKRRPVSDLNHENWNDEEEVEEIGEFQKASNDELKRRTIKKAIRRNKPTDSTDGAAAVTPGSVFSGFGGFGKTGPPAKASSSPFSFLSSTSSVGSSTAAAAATPSTASSSGLSSFNGGSSTSQTPASVTVNLISNTATKSDESAEYYAKLKGLNQSVAAWISQHVNTNPLCVLTPIFEDYAKFLKEIELTKGNTSTTTTTTSNATTKPSEFSFSSATSVLNNNNNKESSFKSAAASTFSFGTKTATTEVPKSSLFSSGPISFGSTTSAAAGGSSGGFSFGGSSSTPFTFANVKKPDEHGQDPVAGTSSTSTGAVDEDNEEPPKNEFTPVVEQDSLFSKRCKVFVKGDKEYAERGVGMLYIKSVEEGAKTQMLVRADTNLGNVLLNILLTDGVPASRMGKNNVLMVCIPTPDAKPPPATVLIRVKNGDEADELLKQINKHKK